MAKFVNKVQLLGNLGADPEVRNYQNGGRVLTFSLATSDTWKDRDSGERKERTTWHRVSIFAEGLIDVAEKYLKKGSKVLVEGKLENREWTDGEGVKRYSTKVALRPFSSDLVLLNDARLAGVRAHPAASARRWEPVPAGVATTCRRTAIWTNPSRSEARVRAPYGAPLPPLSPLPKGSVS